LPKGPLDPDCLCDECRKRGFVDRIILAKVDGADGFAIKPPVEETSRVAEGRAIREGQPHSVLEGFADADVTVAGPDGYPLRPGRLPPFYFFDNAGIGLPNYSANLRQLLPFPAGKIINDVIDFL